MFLSRHDSNIIKESDYDNVFILYEFGGKIRRNITKNNPKGVARLIFCTQIGEFHKIDCPDFTVLTIVFITW